MLVLFGTEYELTWSRPSLFAAWATSLIVKLPYSYSPQDVLDPFNEVWGSLNQSKFTVG